jgi:hypothetical protein
MNDQSRYVLFQALLHLAKDDQLDQAIIQKILLKYCCSKQK